MKGYQKSMSNKSLLNLNISLIEESSNNNKNSTPREKGCEDNPEKSLKGGVSYSDLFKAYSPKSRLQTGFTKYESSLGLNKTLGGTKSSSQLQMNILSPKEGNLISTQSQTSNQPKRPRILSKVKPTVQSPLITQFKQLKLLGKGRFGNVSMVRHSPSGCVYAIKDISTDKMTSKLEQRLLAEIKIQSFLEHKHCLQLYKCFSEGKHLYLVLELGQ